MRALNDRYVQLLRNKVNDIMTTRAEGFDHLQALTDLLVLTDEELHKVLDGHFVTVRMRMAEQLQLLQTRIQETKTMLNSLDKPEE